MGVVTTHVHVATPVRSPAPASARARSRARASATVPVLVPVPVPAPVHALASTTTPVSNSACTAVAVPVPAPGSVPVSVALSAPVSPPHTPVRATSSRIRNEAERLRDIRMIGPTDNYLQNALIPDATGYAAVTSTTQTTTTATTTPVPHAHTTSRVRQAAIVAQANIAASRNLYSVLDPSLDSEDKPTVPLSTHASAQSKKRTARERVSPAPSLSRVRSTSSSPTSPHKKHRVQAPHVDDTESQ